MLYDYFIIVFVLISLIYGLYRGIKREISFFIIFSVAFLGILFSYNTIVGLVAQIGDFSAFFDSLSALTNIIPITETYLFFILFMLLPILLISYLLNGLSYLIFFKRSYNKTKIVSKKERLFGGMVGILVGLELSILMLIVLNGLFDFELNGPLTTLIINYIPNMEELISETSRVIESEAI